MRAGFDVTGLAVQGAVCTCAAVAPADAAFFDGHFPGDPVLAAVAQVSGLAEPAALEAWPDLGALRGAAQLKFHRVCRPGEALSLRCVRDGLSVRFTLHAGSDLASAGELRFSGGAP